MSKQQKDEQAISEPPIHTTAPRDEERQAPTTALDTFGNARDDENPFIFRGMD